MAGYISIVTVFTAVVTLLLVTNESQASQTSQLLEWMATERKGMACKNYLKICSSKGSTNKPIEQKNKACYHACRNDNRRSGKCQGDRCCCAKQHISKKEIRRQKAAQKKKMVEAIKAQLAREAKVKNGSGKHKQKGGKGKKVSGKPSSRTTTPKEPDMDMSEEMEDDDGSRGARHTEEHGGSPADIDDDAADDVD